MWSSMKVIIYHALKNDGLGNDPLISLWTNSSGIDVGHQWLEGIRDQCDAYLNHNH